MSIGFTTIVVDENMPREVVDYLKALLVNSQSFKNVYWIADHRRGIPDPQVWQIATDKDAILLTRDIRFGTQLSEGDMLGGPILVELVSQGISNRDELRDPDFLNATLGWFFSKGHHRCGERIRIELKGSALTRRQYAHRELAEQQRKQRAAVRKRPRMG